MRFEFGEQAVGSHAARTNRDLVHLGETASQTPALTSRDRSERTLLRPCVHTISNPHNASLYVEDGPEFEGPQTFVLRSFASDVVRRIVT